MTEDNNTRSFSYDFPTYYDGATYPTTIMDIEDGQGNISQRHVFADGNGNYFSKTEDGNIVSVMLQHELPGVTVTAPAENFLSKRFNDYITMSNDNTRVLNAPHKEYNSHLKYGTLQGATKSAAWEKEHPYLSGMGYTLGAAPLAVASAPFIIGGGELAGSATVAPWIDAGLTSYFGAKGLIDLVNGNENWETALDIAPLGRVGKSVYDVGKGYFDLGRSWFRRNPLISYNTPKVTSEGVSVGSNAEDIANTANASQSNIVIDQDALNSVENILANNNARLTASRRPQVVIRPTRSVAPTNTTINTSTSNTTSMGTTAREAVAQAAQRQNNTLNSIRSSYLNSSPHTTIKARDIKAGESPYTDEEVNAWINDKGELKDGFEFAPTSKVETGAHGEMYVPKIFPEQDETWVLRQHLSNSSDNAKELKQIMQDNP